MFSVNSLRFCKTATACKISYLPKNFAAVKAINQEHVFQPWRLQSQLLIYLFINSHLLFFILFLYRQFKTCRQQSRIDRRSEPRIGERVPYIIVYGSPGVPLIRLVVPANLLLIDTSLRLNAHYYITRAIIPALQRCLGLLGVDVLSW